jgi:hypothetical protein
MKTQASHVLFHFLKGKGEKKQTKNFQMSVSFLRKRRKGYLFAFAIVVQGEAPSLRRKHCTILGRLWHSPTKQPSQLPQASQLPERI